MANDGDPAPAREIESRLLEFIKRELVSPQTAVGPEDDLLDGELIDSVGALRLATFVAEEFDITVQPADFVIENFRTVAALAAYVLKRRAESAPQKTQA